jgi:hypothetical protein
MKQNYCALWFAVFVSSQIAARFRWDAGVEYPIEARELDDHGCDFSALPSSGSLAITHATTESCASLSVIARAVNWRENLWHGSHRGTSHDPASHSPD